PNTYQTFTIVFADMDDEPTTIIDSSAKLIINVPKDWTVIESSIMGSGFTAPTVTVFGDSSSQIIAETLAPLGDATNLTDTLTFTATSPNISADQLYVMYVLAQGSSGPFSLGPTSEIVLQVVG
ncbi:MAG: hypothetical protein V3R39_00530, partial [Nitrosopumilus sp.]